MNDNFDLSGKVAIIIGGSKGMGLACAELFARSGASVMITSRNQAEAETAADTINEKFGNGETLAVAKSADMVSKDDLRVVVDATLEAFGKITTLVMSPTIRPWFGSAIDTPDAEIDEQFLYIFKSRFWITSMCIPEMAKAGGGSAIWIGSGAVFEATAERSVYSAIRTAEWKMMENFAAEFGKDNIRFNFISPAMIRSSGSQALFRNEEVQRKFSERLPMKRHGEVSEIASVAAFLASESSSFTTGAVIPVDGGRNLHASTSDLTAQFTPEIDARSRTRG
ncbi:SDR family NAD(P)-dependent oxidoreductase [Parasphingorhabdus sp.]|uniref:SDR family NAD(P)-dependent oxidoreductase n=1 Tax=Parasphingorhabdus sp. TaxID=2709688 RepID=UPI0030024BCF